MQEAREYSTITNPYGQLRSPWNVNPSPYFTRKTSVVGMTYATTLPTCTQYKSAFDSSSIAEMNVELNGDTHGPVHILVGGQWDVKLGSTKSGTGWSSVDLTGAHIIGAAQLLLFKVLAL